MFAPRLLRRLSTQRPLRSSVGRHAVPQKRDAAAAPFSYSPLFQTEANPVETPWRKLTSDHVRTVEGANGARLLQVDREAFRLLSANAMRDIAHLLRPAHLQQLRNILDDPEASDNDRFVALELLKNACIASGFVLPGCQDTGTAIVFGKRGHDVITPGFCAEEALAEGVYDTYTESNLRYSQVAPLSMYEEKNTGCNLPAQIDTYAVPGDEYKLGFVAKGGGSANKTFLFQQTKALLNPDSMMAFLEEKIKTLGTSRSSSAACRPSSRSRRSRWPRSSTWTASRRRATRRAAPSGI
jgi:fumarate hydratase class I